MTNTTRPPIFTFRRVSVVITFVVVALAVFFGVQLASHTGVFHQPGELIFAADTTELVQDFVKDALEGVELAHDLTISTATTTSYTPAADTILYDILVPTADFYDGTIDISSADIGSAIDAPLSALDTTAATGQAYSLTSVRDLDFTKHLLSLDGNYYFDNFTSGAFFRTITLASSDTAELTKISSLLPAASAPLPTADTILSFAQTGVTALSRNMNAKLRTLGDAALFATNIAPYLSSFDLTHTSNEASFVDNAPAQSGTSVICSETSMINTLTAIGLDIVELTGNHNQDCGDEAAIATIDTYTSLGIKTVGGGKTATDAAIPLELSAKGTNITLLAYNLSTGGYTTDDTPGANFYTAEKATADIAAAQERGDFVIVDIQYYECNAYVSTTEDETCDYANSAAGDQVGFFRSLIDLGADMVVGTSAHQPQTYELYNGKPIYYGLGNLFFDQSWWPGTSRSLILAHYFWNGRLVQTRLVPTVYDSSYQTKLMEEAYVPGFLTRLASKHP